MLNLASLGRCDVSISGGLFAYCAFRYGCRRQHVACSAPCCCSLDLRKYRRRERGGRAGHAHLDPRACTAVGERGEKAGLVRRASSSVHAARECAMAPCTARSAGLTSAHALSPALHGLLLPLSQTRSSFAAGAFGFRRYTHGTRQCLNRRATDVSGAFIDCVHITRLCSPPKAESHMKLDRKEVGVSSHTSSIDKALIG